MKQLQGSPLKRGLFDGIPIALGYLSVSFSFGIAAVVGGLSPLSAVLISLTNLTSAGQMAGLGIILGAGPFLEMVMTQFIINIRYFLMSLSLSQRLSPAFTLRHRLLAAFGITDEIFGVAASQKEPLLPRYMYGLILFPLLGWTLGTLLGAIAGNILPNDVRSALGIAIYGMFVAIVVPPAKRDRGVAVGVLIAIFISCLLAYLPLFSFVTSGFSIIISAVAAAAIAAAIFPIAEEDQKEEEEASA